MRKTLLLFASMVVGATSALAQWTKPVPTAFVPMADDGETEQYLYNIEAGGFFMAGNDWNTRASINYSEGAKVKMTKLHDADTGEPTGTWAIVNYVPKFQEYRKAFADNVQAIWTDNNAGANCDGWVVTALGANRYEISNPSADDEGCSSKLGMARLWKGEPNTRLWLLDPDNEELRDADGKLLFDDACTTWAFVAADEYDLLYPRMQAYAAAVSLRTAIDRALADTPGLTLAAQEAVYANTASTADELKLAEQSIEQAIKDFTSSLASVDNPADYTKFIVNPSFETGNADGWKYDGKNSLNGFGEVKDAKVAEVGEPGSTYYCSEADGRYLFNIWAWGNPITQKIENLPNGIYRLTAMVASSPDCTNVYVTAESGLGKTWHAIALEGGPDDNRQTYGTRGSMVTVVNDGTLTIGAVGPDADGVSYLEGGRWWYKVDDFRLEYLGNAVEAWEYYNANSDLAFTEYDDETVAMTQLLADYHKALADYLDSPTGDAFAEALGNLKELAQQVKDNIAAYERLSRETAKLEDELGSSELVGLIYTFMDLVMGEEKGEDLIAEMRAEGVPDDKLVDFSPKWLLGDEGRCYGTAQVDEYVARLEALYAYCVKNSLYPGADCSSMLINPTFADGFKGWTNLSGNVGGITTPAELEYQSVESYDAVVDCYQIVEKVPNGIYSLSCNAFERPAGNGSYTGDEEAKVFLYMNDFQTPVQNIVADALPADEAKPIDKDYSPEANPVVNCYPEGHDFPDGSQATRLDQHDYEVEGKGYVPNGMAGAALAFKSGRYVQKVYGIVDNGTMKIGLTSNGVKAHWVLWSNFKLTYEGLTDESVAAIAASYVGNAEDLLAANDDRMSDPAKAALAEAIDAVKDAAGTQEKYDCIIALNKVMPEAKANVAAVAGFIAARDAMTDAMESNPNPTAEADAAYNEVADAEFADLTTKEIEDMAARMNLVAAMLRLPNTAGAAFDNPVDMTSAIVNPDFSTENTSGWTLTIDAKNLGYNKGDITFEDVTLSKFAEAWKAGPHTLGDGAISQVIAALPAGAYLLEADANAVQQADKETPVEGACIFAQEGDGAWRTVAVHTGDGLPQHYKLYFEKASAESSLTIGFGVKSTTANWIAVDNFRLFYLGDSGNEEFIALGISESSHPATAGIAAAAAPCAVYSAAGLRLSRLAKGINIVRMPDGSVRKVHVK